MTDQAPAAGGQGTDPGANPAAGGQGTDPGANPAAQAPNWLTGADELTVGYVQNKGWTEPVQVLESYRNLEKLMGADKAGNAVILPKPDATPEEMGKFYDRLGRPGDPGGYKIDIPEGIGDPAFAKEAASVMHELGLSKAQGEKLAAWNNQKAVEAKAAADNQRLTNYTQDDQVLRQEWGAAFQQNVVAAQAAARGLGINDKQIDGLQAALGHKGTMDLLYKIGSKMGESDFVTGDKTEKFGAAITPGQAKAQIDALKADKAFVSRYASGDAAARAEMKRLHEFAYPEG